AGGVRHPLPRRPRRDPTRRRGQACNVAFTVSGRSRHPGRDPHDLPQLGGQEVMNQSSSRLVMVAGLFLFAVVWVALMGLVTWLLGGGRATAGVAPVDDGSIKARITSLDRGK